MAKNTQFISVNCLDSLFIKGVPVIAGDWKNEILIEQQSSALTQEPVAVDTPIRIEFGPSANGPTDPMEMDATGLFTVNETNTYRFDVTINFGRTGAALTSILIATVALNGVVNPNARPIHSLITSPDLIIPGQFTLFVPLTAGDTVEFLIARDSSGTNAGGLFSFSPTTLPWPDSATAGIEVSHLVPT